MRSLWIAMALLALVLVGALAWLAVDRGPREAVNPPSARIADPHETGAAPLLAAESPTVDPAPVESKRVEVDQQRETRLLVRVRAEESGAPLAGVRVAVYPDPPEDGFAMISGQGSVASLGTSARTDAEGRAEIRVPAGKGFRLTARSRTENRAPANVQIDPLVAGEAHELEVKLAIQSDLHFVLRAVDAEGRAPLPSAWADVASPEFLVQQASRRVSDSTRPVLLGERTPEAGEPTRIEGDGSGYIELDDRSWLHKVVRVQAPGYAWVLVPIDRGCETRATAREVRLSRSAVLDVVVLGPGRVPVQDARVRLSTRSYQVMQSGTVLGSFFMSADVTWEAHTGPDGRARIEDLPGEVPLDLEFLPPGEKVERRGQPLTLQAGETLFLELALGSGAVVAGWLRTPDGSPAPPCEIWMKPGADGWGFRSYERDKVRTTHSDVGGRFLFSDVPDGTWMVGPAPERGLAPVTEEVTVEAGVADHEVDLTAWVDLTIQGTVVGPDGKGVQAFVSAFGQQTQIHAQGRAEVDGSFSLGPLAPGSYRLSVHTLGAAGGGLMQADRPTAEAGASDVVLRLETGGSIAGRIVDAATGAGLRGQVVCSPRQIGSVVRGASISSANDEGRFHFYGLPPGTYSLGASTAGGSCGVLPEVHVAAGEVVECQDISLRPGARVTVRYDGEQEHGQFEVLQDGVVVALDGVQRGTSATWVVPAGRLDVVRKQYSPESPGAPRTTTKSIVLAAGELGEVRFGPDDDPR